MLKLTPLLRQLTIKTKNLQLRRFDIEQPDPVEGDLGWAQRRFVADVERQYNAGRPVRTIVLKARQLGISTATEGTIFNWAFLHHGMNGLVMTHERPQSAELFSMTKNFWDTWPFRRLFTKTTDTKQQMAWLETRSQIRVATAKNVQSGRGSTLHAVHASECAFYDDPDTLWTGLDQTIPNKHGTIIVLESTANGVGNWFHEKWLAAEEGESEWSPLFFPYFEHPEYRMPTTLNVRSELDDDEKMILALMKQKEVRYPFEAIAWRRWKIINSFNGDVEDFRQEYPATPEEAFITSGRPVFPQDRLRDSFKEERGIRGYLYRDHRGRVQFARSDSGSVILYRSPNPDGRSDRYFLGGDPTRTVGGDPACMQVINRLTFEQVAVWHGNIEPIGFAKEMELLGEFYHTCMVCPEVEAAGQATIATLLADDYPNIWQHRWADKAPGKVSQSYGWLTNYNRKRWALGHILRAIIDGSLTIHDRKTYNQMRSYVFHEDGSLGNEGNNVHDDAVMALMIALAASITEGPFVPETNSENPIYDIYRQEYEYA